MRIVAGIYKSRPIKAPKGDTTRPTSDKVKESMFNIIQHKVYHAKCLDLFAGSGNLGLEALSRGADCCYFVDENVQAIRIVKENIEALKIQEQTKVFHMDYLKALYKFNQPFDIIFLDPPYRYQIIEKIVDVIEKKKLLNEYGLILYESNLENQVGDHQFDEKYQLKKYKYGQTMLNVLLKNENVEN